MMFANVLLINLLVALFATTYERVQENSENIWKLNRYDLILEYWGKSPLRNIVVHPLITSGPFPICLIVENLDIFNNVKLHTICFYRTCSDVVQNVHILPSPTAQQNCLLATIARRSRAQSRTISNRGI